MITINEVKQIISKLSLEKYHTSDDDLINNISCIIYRNDVFEYGNITTNSRHIDIEFLYGEYYEIHETTSLFQFICALCNLPLLQEEQELVIYQK